MTILALETTDKVASVALLTDSGCREMRIDSPLRHEETVMPAVERAPFSQALRKISAAAFTVSGVTAFSWRI